MNRQQSFARGNQRRSSSHAKRDRKMRHGALAFNAKRASAAIFDLTPLEQRLFMSFAPSISGAASVVGGQPYTLNLNSTGTTVPVSWSINWGDNSDPDGNGTGGEQFNGNPSTRTHTYAATPTSY